MEKNKKDKDFATGIIFNVGEAILIILIFCIVGEPDLLDQFIAIAKNYSETIKCK